MLLKMGKRCKNTACSSATDFTLSRVYNVSSQHHQKKRRSDGTGSSKSFQLNMCSLLPQTREQWMTLDLMSPSYLYKINMTFLSVRWKWDRGSIFSVPNGLSWKDCSTYTLERIFQSNLHVQSPLVSNHLPWVIVSKTPKFSHSKPYSWNLL